ncbi:MAG TPA: HNH endonuclease [Ruminiclostridium sp.]
MSFKRTYKSWIYTNVVFECDNCKIEIDESFPRVDIDGKDYCPECGFKLGYIDEVEYVRICGGVKPDMFAAGINPLTGEIELTLGSALHKLVKGHYVYIRTQRSKFSWEKSSRNRGCLRYTNWRISVFERDNYKCLHCGQVGGTLNAHHIKGYAKFQRLRYEINNGITLCESCHKLVHKKKVEN